MKNALLVMFLVLAVVAAAGLGMWGNEQRVGKAEMLKVLEGLHLDAQGAPAETTAAEEGAAPVKEGLSPEGMGREIQRAIDNLRTELDLAQGKIAAQQTEIEEYRGRVQSAEQRVDVVSRAARQQAEVAAESARAETAEQIVDARRETDQAIREKVKIANELAALQTKYDELKSSYDALLAATDEFLADSTVGADDGESERDEEAVEGEDEEPQEAADEPAADVVEPAPDRADEVLASIPETPQTADDSAALKELEGTKVGMSRYFLAIVYDEAEGTLRFTLQNGEVLVYEGVSGTLAERIRMAGNSVDSTYDHLVRGRLRCDRKESAVWKAYEKWAQDDAELIEAVWVRQE